jgi:hypothetical protein
MYHGQEASDLIYSGISSKHPFFAGRLGSTELWCLLNYLSINDNKSMYFKSIEFIRGERQSFWWEPHGLVAIQRLSGFFPATHQLVERYCELLLDCFTDVDVLGSWLTSERYLDKRLGHVKKIPLQDLEPYFHEKPWSFALEGKKVLVVHPFASSIKLQYQNRSVLFRNSCVLPEFHLDTVQAVQSIANNKNGFNTWFEAYEYMKAQIGLKDFHVAILGCGAYGFPLASWIKRNGNKAIHLGGATQLLFGIRGKRWDHHGLYMPLFNEHWIHPSEDERPPDYTVVEEGCYW